MTLSWIYLVATLIGLWFTKQALRPVQLPSVRAVPSFFAGWLTNELAFHHLAWQAIATALFVRAGVLHAWPGRVGLGITLVQWIGIAVLIRRIFAARIVVEEALAEALRAFGEPPEDVEPSARAVRWSQLVLPLPVRHPKVVARQRGVTFARAGGLDLQLDVYRHRDLPTRRPVLLYVHGGAWVISNRNEQGLPLMNEMASRGWVGVNADYRLSPWATFPDHLVDVKRAIAWVRAHADDIGADPRFIAIAGGSAGGHLAALAALTPDDARYQPAFEDADTQVQACISFYGVYDLLDRERHRGRAHEDVIRRLSRHVMKATPEDDPALWLDASPIEHVRPDAPPFFVVHGELDTLAPAASARAFAARLAATSSSPVAYAELPGAQHAFDVFPSLRTSYVLDGVGEFLQCAWLHWRSLRAGDGAMREG